VRPDVEAQRLHWANTFAAHPEMYGPEPSAPGADAAQLFALEGCRTVLELGAGQGRDTLAFLRSGLHVTAVDYVRRPLPLPDASVDAV
jgi:hypothetical protein